MPSALTRRTKRDFRRGCDAALIQRSTADVGIIDQQQIECVGEAFKLTITSGQNSRKGVGHADQCL